jgi:hypothetical protein
LKEILGIIRLPELEIEEFVDEFGGVGDRAAHIDSKLEKK